MDSNTQVTEGNSTTERAQIAGDDQLSAFDTAMDCFRQYTKERPETVALWALGIGFVLGWKLKPW
ncbi:MAG TPA: hypothetical protein VMM76_02130 [Pirellulaceae bacterium]|nr:hypothetical protein [Pirellulaceae bacterium]